ncbi:hypothetical protein ACQRBK_04030 [Peptoniphilaceae bacterium SGI.137]|nr:hypothetical protein [Peptoniphilaceae bacterium]MDY4195929.1 hypothetical protein [Peptoniphilaceae bacterium]MDY6147269.1 hypothetical protein [Peptoniphilaceae bacterium]
MFHVAIQAEDQEYANRWISAIRRENPGELLISKINSQDFYDQNPEQYDLILIVNDNSLEAEEKTELSECGNRLTKKIKYLVQDRRLMLEHPERFIYRYLPAPDMIRVLMGFLPAQEGSVFSEQRGKIFRISACTGGLGASICARDLAKAICWQYSQKRILLLELDPFPYEEQIFERQGMSTASDNPSCPTFRDLAIAAKSRHGNLADKANACVQRTAEGYYFFRSSRDPGDFFLEPEEWRRIFEAFQMCFDEMILDIHAHENRYWSRIFGTSMPSLYLVSGESGRLRWSKICSLREMGILYSEKKDFVIFLQSDASIMDSKRVCSLQESKWQAIKNDSTDQKETFERILAWHEAALYLH